MQKIFVDNVSKRSIDTAHFLPFIGFSAGWFIVWTISWFLYLSESMPDDKTSGIQRFSVYVLGIIVCSFRARDAYEKVTIKHLVPAESH